MEQMNLRNIFNHLLRAIVEVWSNKYSCLYPYNHATLSSKEKTNWRTWIAATLNNFPIFQFLYKFGCIFRFIPFNFWYFYFVDSVATFFLFLTGSVFFI